MDFNIPDGEITELGLRKNINISILYIGEWLNGNGAVALYNLMEDAATAEISRSQLWQWVHHPGGVLSDGREINEHLINEVINEEIHKIQELVGKEKYQEANYDRAVNLLKNFILEPRFPDFLTLEAYHHLK